MPDETRAEIARDLAGRRDTVPDPLYRRRAAAIGDAAEAARAEEAARLTAELRRTERRLDRLERSFSPSRYQLRSAGPPTGRYARLLSRAQRLERQLSTLR